LLSGSKIIGAIDLGGNTDTANIYAGSASANLTFLATENINLFGAGVVVGTNVVTVDATAESSRSVVLSGLTSSVHQVVNQRMAHTTPLKPVQLASLELSPGMLFQERAPVTWAQVFGGTSDRDGEGNALGYETDHHGFAAGYEWDSNKTRVGLMGGVALSDTAAEADSFQTDVNSYFLGAYGHFNMGSVNLTASVLTGYGDHDNERLVVDNINGLEVASSDVSSIFLSPSLTLSAAYTASETVEIRPSATISYSVAWMDDYKEKGTTSSNLTVDDRTLESWNAKLQLASAYKIDDTKELELRVGVNSRHSNDDSTHASLAGNDFSFSGVGDDSVTGGFVGANIRVATQNNLSLVADMEYGKSSDEDNLAGSLSLNYTF
jgi:outer membrane autotransporter protein